MKPMLKPLAWSLMAIAPVFVASAAFAQTAEPRPDSSLPRFTRPDAPAVVQTPVPGAAVTRDQAPLPLGTVYNTPIEQFEPPFADVPTDHWAYEAVTRLFYSGIVNGFPANP